MNTLILTRRDVQELLDIDACIAAVEAGAGRGVRARSGAGARLRGQADRRPCGGGPRQRRVRHLHPVARGLPAPRSSRSGDVRRGLVEKRRWFAAEEYRDGLALAQLAPGPLAAQLAMYFGWARGGAGGALALGVRALPFARRPRTALALALVPPRMVAGLAGKATSETLGRIGWYIAEAGAFVFGSAAVSARWCSSGARRSCRSPCSSCRPGSSG